MNCTSDLYKNQLILGRKRKKQPFELIQPNVRKKPQGVVGSKRKLKEQPENKVTITKNNQISSFLIMPLILWRIFAQAGQSTIISKELVLDRFPLFKGTFSVSRNGVFLINLF